MVVEISPYEDPRYWAGDLTWRPGFIKIPYSDFSINDIKAAYIASKRPIGKVLDAGAAMGFLVRRLRRLSIDAYGVDISHYAIDHAPEEIKPFLVQGDITDLSMFQDQEFDLIVCCGVMEHFTGDTRERAISELTRVSKRGVISITLKGDPGAEEDVHHHSLLTRSEWQSLFPPAFEVVSDSEEEWRYLRPERSEEKTGRSSMTSVIEFRPPETRTAVPSIKGYFQYILTAVPRQVRIESSSHCNLACPWCHGHGFRKMARTKGFIDLSLVEHLLQEIAGWSAPLYEIVPTNFGEWFMYQRWYEMGCLIDKYLPKTRMTLPTTGVLLDEKKLTQLASFQTLKWVNFSVNAYFAETYERIHGASSRNILKVREMIQRLRDMRPDVHVQVSMVYDPSITSEMERDLFQAYWEGLCQVSINTASYAGRPDRAPVPSLELPCRSVFDGLVIFDDGCVSNGCCFNGDNDPDLSIGHVPEETLLDIWRGDKLRRLADLHNSGQRAQLTICKNCTFA